MGSSKLRLKSKKQSQSELQDVESINLANDLSQIPYSELAPRNHRKLYNLHTSIQEDKAVRLPKQKPQFSYASGKQPDLPFLHNSKSINDILGDPEDSDDIEEFPLPSELMGIKEARSIVNQDLHGFESGGIEYHEDPIAIYNEVPQLTSQDDDLGDLEAGMLDLPDPITHQALTPKVASSLVNEVFDFKAYNNHHENLENPTNPVETKIPAKDTTTSPTSKESLKRKRSFSPDLPDVKHARVTKIEPPSQPSQNPNLPSWAGEIDSEILNGLLGFVDFVD